MKNKNEKKLIYITILYILYNYYNNILLFNMYYSIYYVKCKNYKLKRITKINTRVLY